MKRLSVYFFTGLITILPVALTVYLLYIFLVWTENLALGFLRPFIGSFYIPGMGLTLGVLGILLIGYLVSKQRVRSIVSFMERPFTNTPVIKSIYSSLKSFADYFSPGGKQNAQQVVVMRIPGQDMEMVGLVTRNTVEGLPQGFMQGSRVAVYLPMGYMIGGYTVFVPSEWVQPVAMSVEEAMRSSLIAWMAGAEGTRPVGDPAAAAADAERLAALAADGATPLAPTTVASGPVGAPASASTASSAATGPVAATAPGVDVGGAPAASAATAGAGIAPASAAAPSPIARPAPAAPAPAAAVPSGATPAASAADSAERQP